MYVGSLEVFILFKQVPEELVDVEKQMTVQVLYLKLPKMKMSK